MTEPDAAEPTARSGRLIVLAIATLIMLWTVVLGALLWKGMQEPRWLRVSDPDAPSKSPTLIVVPSKPAPAASPPSKP